MSATNQNPMELTERIARQDPGQASAVRQNDSGKTLQDPKLKVRLFKTWAFQTPSRQHPVATEASSTGAQKAHAIFRSTMTNNKDPQRADRSQRIRSLSSASDVAGNQSPYAPVRASGDTPSPEVRFQVACHPKPSGRRVVEPNGIEPMTSCLQSRRSPS